MIVQNHKNKTIKLLSDKSLRKEARRRATGETTLETILTYIAFLVGIFFGVKANIWLGVKDEAVLLVFMAVLVFCSAVLVTAIEAVFKNHKRLNKAEFKRILKPAKAKTKLDYLALKEEVKLTTNKTALKYITSFESELIRLDRELTDAELDEVTTILDDLLEGAKLRNKAKAKVNEKFEEILKGEEECHF